MQTGSLRVKYLPLTMLSLMLYSELSFGDGQCNFIFENTHAGPYRACWMPLDQAGCEQLGLTNQNKDAVFAGGSCPTEGLVGTCTRDLSTIFFYEGNVLDHQVHCDAEGGTWTNPP